MCQAEHSIASRFKAEGTDSLHWCEQLDRQCNNVTARESACQPKCSQAASEPSEASERDDREAQAAFALAHAPRIDPNAPFC